MKEGNRLGVAAADPSERPASGFSLVELLVVVGIITILFALVLGMATIGIGLSHRSTCASNLRQMSTVFRMYRDENSDAYPHDLRVIYPNYLNDLRILVCPSTGAKVGTIDNIESWTSYEYRTGYSPSMGTVLREKERNHLGKRLVLRRDVDQDIVITTSGNGY